MDCASTIFGIIGTKNCARIIQGGGGGGILLTELSTYLTVAEDVSSQTEP